MSNIKIHGISQNSFYARTKRALESITGSPIHKQRLVRKFLTLQLHGSEGNGNNEHNLASAFSQSAGQPDSIFKLELISYEENDGKPTVIDTKTIDDIQIESDVIKDAFRSWAPEEFDNSRIIESNEMEDFIDRVDLTDREIEQLYSLGSIEMIDFLINNLGEDDLVSEDLFDFALWDGKRSINIRKTLAKPGGMQDSYLKLIEWFGSDGVGSSSTAMALTACGLKADKHSYPCDPGDFNRCLMLIRAVPAVRDHFEEIAKLGDTWASIIERWDEIEALFLAEAGINWSKSRNAPKTFSLICSILQLHSNS